VNAKQFVSSVVLRGVDFGASKFPIVGKLVSIPLRIVFPTMGYERVNISAMRLPVFLSVCAVGFLVCFVLQAYLAHRAGYLGNLDVDFGPTNASVGQPERVMFFDDAHNLFNYAILVPLYLVAGTGYVISLFSLRERMTPVSGGYGFQLDDSVKPYLSGMVAVGVFLVLLTLIQAGYAVDIQEKSQFLFWFHGETKTSRFGYNGYAYLVINVFLNGFVLFIALLHLELFRWSHILTKSIRGFDSERMSEANAFANDGNKLKELFAPFTETAIWSKAFTMLLAINIFTWKESGVSGAVDSIEANSWFFRFIFMLYIVIVLWIVSLPRYRIQYELFKLRRQEGVHEYFDIRMPWTIGWSVFIDFLLLTFFTTSIFGSGEIFHLFMSLFES